MIRNGVLDMVKVGDTYQIVDPGVICLPDLSRENVKRIRQDYIEFGRAVFTSKPSLALPPPRPKKKSKYELRPHSILAAAVHLECKRKDTVFSYALGKAAGYKLLKLGEDPTTVIEPIYQKYKPVKHPKKATATWWDKPPENPPWDNYCARSEIKKDDGWRWHPDGYYMKPTFQQPDDGFIHKIHLGKTVKPTPKYMDDMEQRRYDAYVKGEVACG